MLDEMKKDLEKEFSEICEYSDDCENKQKALQANTNDSKLTKTGVIGMLSILPSIFASVGIVFPISAGLSLPITYATGVALASSIAIGYVGQSIITSISKRKMKKFTSAKTNADILEEMMHYEMEIDKSENKKEALRKMYKAIESKQQILSDYSNEFYQIDKYANFTLEDLKKRQEMLSKAYEERMEQLDVLTSQSYLKNKFRSRRKKRERIEGIITSALMMSLPFCLIIGMPLSLELMRDVTMETFADFGKYIAMWFSPTLVVTPLALPYFIKRDKDFTNAFNNLNQLLDENALSEKPNVEYENELKNMISTKLCEIVELGIELKEIGYAIEKTNVEKSTENKDNSKSKEDILFQDYPPLHITEETRRDVLEHPEKYMSCDVRTRMGKFYTDEEYEQRREEVLNRPLPGGEEKGPRLVKKRIPPKK